MAGSEAAAREEGGAALAAALNEVEGRGGPVAAHDFGSEAPAQAAVTQYACEAIWGSGGTFAWNAGNDNTGGYPAMSGAG
jgi:hypothetical protein